MSELPSPATKAVIDALDGLLDDIAGGMLGDDTIRKGYDAIAQAEAEGLVSEDNLRIRASAKAESEAVRQIPE